MIEYKEACSDAHKPVQEGRGHSTKGLGKTVPDPVMVDTIEDGVVVPFGTPVSQPSVRSALLYNEYVVYDTAQVQIKYLLKVRGQE